MQRDRDLHPGWGLCSSEGMQGGIQSHLCSLRMVSAMFPGELLSESSDPYLEGKV